MVVLPVILALGKLMQEDCTKSEASMGSRHPISKQQRLERGELRKRVRSHLLAVSFFHLDFQFDVCTLGIRHYLPPSVVKAVWGI